MRFRSPVALFYGGEGGGGGRWLLSTFFLPSAFFLDPNFLLSLTESFS